MWIDFPTMPTTDNAVGSKQEILVYWPQYLTEGSHLSVHVIDSVADLLTLEKPPTKWFKGIEALAEDTAPATIEDKTATLAQIIKDVDEAGGDSSILKEIATDAKYTLPADDAKAQTEGN